MRDPGGHAPFEIVVQYIMELFTGSFSQELQIHSFNWSAERILVTGRLDVHIA